MKQKIQCEINKLPLRSILVINDTVGQVLSKSSYTHSSLINMGIMCRPLRTDFKPMCIG